MSMCISCLLLYVIICYEFCAGTSTVAVLDSTRTGHVSIYHSKCDILIKPGDCKRCESCKAYRKTLSAMLSRHSRRQNDDRTNPSSHTTFANLQPAEKDERLKRLRDENKKAKLYINRLKKKIDAATAKDGVELDIEMSNDLEAIMTTKMQQIHSAYPEGSFLRLFWDQQQTALSLKDSRSMKWHPLVIKWCLYLRHLSGKGYELLRKSGCLKLPSQRTLRDYTHYTSTTIGFSAETDRDLFDAAFLSNDLNRYLFLIMDEVHIKNDLVYDKHNGSLIGFVNLGDTNNKLLQFENAMCGKESQEDVASTMLVFMVRGIFYKLNYPYAQFSCKDLSGDLMFDLVWEAVSRLERMGFRVLGVTCDGASPNRRLWKLHSQKDEMIYKVPNIFAPEGSRYLYFISDPPHLLKTIRNSWSSSNRHLWVSKHTFSNRHVLIIPI